MAVVAVASFLIIVHGPSRSIGILCMLLSAFHDAIILSFVRKHEGHEQGLPIAISPLNKADAFVA